jgi:hypothetical protein
MSSINSIVEGGDRATPLVRQNLWCNLFIDSKTKVFEPNLTFPDR